MFEGYVGDFIEDRHTSCISRDVSLDFFAGTIQPGEKIRLFDTQSYLGFLDELLESL
jgi:hypothetical protein